MDSLRPRASLRDEKASPDPVAGGSPDPDRAAQEDRMTKADIVDQISERTGLTKKDVAETVDSFLNAVARALANGHHIEIRGFGTFRVKDRKSRIARNPRTGEAVPVPPRKVPVFKVSKELKDMVAQG
ncbi:MAG: HU family DNA-binding protein [Candidatus Eisenbacteria bacterium]